MTKGLGEAEIDEDLASERVVGAGTPEDMLAKDVKFGCKQNELKGGR